VVWPSGSAATWKEPRLKFDGASNELFCPPLTLTLLKLMTGTVPITPVESTELTPVESIDPDVS
jgi:hypothetical protein